MVHPPQACQLFLAEGHPAPNPRDVPTETSPLPRIQALGFEAQSSYHLLSMHISQRPAPRQARPGPGRKPWKRRSRASASASSSSTKIETPPNLRRGVEGHIHTSRSRRASFGLAIREAGAVCRASAAQAGKEGFCRPGRQRSH